MYAVLKSFGLKGLNGFPVEVEADISGGMPARPAAAWMAGVSPAVQSRLRAVGLSKNR